MGKSILRALAFCTILILTLTACGIAANPGPTPTPYGATALASVFRDLNDKLGGVAVLGEAISAPFPHDLSTCQYTENVLLCYNPDAKVEAERVTLVPLGTQIITRPPATLPKIFENFQGMYERMFGTLYVGRPLTGGRYNSDERRYEQYFENMGFYQRIDDPRGTVHLMAYGSYFCKSYCAFTTSHDGIVVGYNTGIEFPGVVSINRLGGIAVFGSPITKPFQAKDGATEQVLDNVAYYIPADDPSTIRLRPLALLLHIRQEAPGPQKYGRDQGMAFYPVQGALGYHVPIVFDAFIAAHGGIALAGNPTSDPFYAEVNGAKLARQCFENYCLEYDPSAPADQRVRMVPLGSQYRAQDVSDTQWAFHFSPDTTRLTVSKLHPEVTSKEEQQIQVLVTQVTDTLPIQDIDAILVVSLPDGTKVSYNVPPTGPDGKSTVTIPPVSNAANSTIVPLVVCLNVPADTPICQREAYLIWNAR